MIITSFCFFLSFIPCFSSIFYLKVKVQFTTHLRFLKYFRCISTKKDLAKCVSVVYVSHIKAGLASECMRCNGIQLTNSTAAPLSVRRNAAWVAPNLHFGWRNAPANVMHENDINTHSSSVEYIAQKRKSGEEEEYNMRFKKQNKNSL